MKVKENKTIKFKEMESYTLPNTKQSIAVHGLTENIMALEKSTISTG